MKSLIELRQFFLFSKGEDSELLLRATKLSIEEGKLIAILGVNGCGKSTLMQAIAGKYSGWSGDVVTDQSLQSKNLNRNLAFVGTTVDRSLQFTVEEVIKMGRHPYLRPWQSLGREDDRLVTEAAAQLALQDKLNKPVGALSDGELRRVFLAQALAQNPKMLLLDEPLNFLDIKHQYDMLLLMRELAHEQNKSILFSTHHPELALQVVDEVWVFDNLSLITGTPEQILQDNTIEKVFGSDKIVFDSVQMKFKLKN